MEIWRTLDGHVHEGSETANDAYIAAFNRTRRLFLSIQEKEPTLAALPLDWSEFTLDRKQKSEYFEAIHAHLQGFVRLCNVRARFYGGLKSDVSIRKKLDAGEGGLFFDLWDVVRFRVVLHTLPEIIEFSQTVWGEYFDSVVKCRNFYYRPRSGPNDPYRAIHFELLFNDKPFELQVMSRYREAVCLLDHQFILKRNLTFLNSHHESWLRAISRAANVLETV